MYTVAILEHRRRLSAFLSEALPEHIKNTIDLCPGGSLPRGEIADLLVIAPDFQKDDPPDIACGALLVPGYLSRLAGKVKTNQVVSYGISPKNSLTLSSLGEREICLAIQRELITLSGDCLPCQELLLPHGGCTAPYHLLACAGIQLLLDVPPQKITVAGSP